jgi:hypothetical protein
MPVLAVETTETRRPRRTARTRAMQNSCSLSLRFAHTRSGSHPAVVYGDPGFMLGFEIFDEGIHRRFADGLWLSMAKFVSTFVNVVLVGRQQPQIRAREGRRNSLSRRISYTDHRGGYRFRNNAGVGHLKPAVEACASLCGEVARYGSRSNPRTAIPTPPVRMGVQHRPANFSGPTACPPRLFD